MSSLLTAGEARTKARKALPKQPYNLRIKSKIPDDWKSELELDIFLDKTRSSLVYRNYGFDYFLGLSKTFDTRKNHKIPLKK